VTPGRGTVGTGVDVVVDVGVDVGGTLVVDVGGDPICWAPGMRLKSGCGNGMAGCPASAAVIYAPQMPAG
jgi:hypothetical protein